MNDESLRVIIAGAQRGDRAALAALVERYAGRLFGFFYHMTGRRDDAEEMMQEVFLRVVRMIGAYSDHGRFEPWLFRIAANLTRDRIRRDRRSPMVCVTESDEPDGDPLPGAFTDESPADRSEQNEEIDRLNAALAQLPEAERQVVMLRHFSQMSFKEIAELMGTPLGTALARAHRGLARLRVLMEGHEGASDHDAYAARAS
ncbi:MAG: sigma-70 family RNA polymerase sigma factor [Phycisphaerae bacterium]|nr:sigma-70 family RNA polymerase sigma factor [Phycisphaerae bacterium]NUQ46462.1 sigma-70 family RNA polymerase sigma factor [Phycisphaerae bacterium]